MNTPSTALPPARPPRRWLPAWILGLMLGTMLLLGLLLAAEAWMFTRADERQQSVTQAVEVQRDVEQLRADSQRMGRLVLEAIAVDQTPDAAALAAYWTEVRQRLDGLALRLRDDPGQMTRLQALRSAMGAQYARLQRLHGLAPAEREPALAETQAARRQMQEQFDAIHAAVGLLREQRDAELARAQYGHGLLIVAAALLALLLVGTAVLLGAREARQRLRAEAALDALNAELAQQVATRTTELSLLAAQQRLRGDCAAWMLATLDDDDDARVLEGCRQRLLSGGFVAKLTLQVVGLPPLGAEAATAPGQQSLPLAYGLGLACFVPLAGTPGDTDAADSLRPVLDDIATWLQLRRERSARRQAEQRRDASARLIGTLVETVPVGLAVFDRQSRLVHANAPLAALAGCALPALAGRLQCDPGLAPLVERVQAVLEGRAALAPERLVLGERQVLVSAMPHRVGDAPPDGVALAVTDVSALDQARQRSAELSRRLLQVEESERRALALELHDDFGQRLAALKMNLGLLALGRDAAERERSLQDSRQIVEGCIAQVRHRVATLRPPLLDELGLDAALTSLAAAQARRAGAEVPVRVEPELARRADEWATHVFRIVQEALRNALEHGHARRVQIELRRNADEVVLEVRDDGVGLAPDAAGRGTGLSGMRERVQMHGGRFEIERLRPLGTRVAGRWPAAALGLAAQPAERRRAA